MGDGAFRALGDPTRRAILRLLADGDLTAGEIGERFPITSAALSHHFNVLKSAGLVTSTRRGQQIVYALHTTAVQDLIRSLMDVFPNGEKP